MKIQLGNKVRDKVSGFRGIAIGRAVYLNGCTHIMIQPTLDKDGKYVDAHWFDDVQLQILDGGLEIEETKEEKPPGGPALGPPPPSF